MDRAPQIFPKMAPSPVTPDMPTPPALSNLPRRRTSLVARTSLSAGVNRGAGLHLDLGDITNAGAPTSANSNATDEDQPPQSAPVVPTPPATTRVYVRPTPTQLQERQQRIQAAARQSVPSAPSFIRKKSGELVKPALKTLSMFTQPRPEGITTSSIATSTSNASGLKLSMDGLPLASGTRSEPTTPLGPKMVHFDVKLEHVKHFLAEQKPLAVSRDGSPTETSEGGEDYLSYRRNGYSDGGGRSSEDEKVRKTLDLHLTNMPSRAALEEMKEKWEGMHVRIESLTLAEDGRAVRGVVLVRNLAFGKRVAARFTMDKWQTTSEVMAKYVSSVQEGAYDRFEFAIRLADYLGGKIWEKTLEIAVRYSADGHGDMWDSNAGKNYVVQFRRKTLPRPVSEPTTDDDEDAEVIRRRNEQVGLKVAQLKKSLEKVIQGPSSTSTASSSNTRPSLSARFGTTPAPLQLQPAVSSPSQTSFVNSRSAADVLSRVGRQGQGTGSPSAMNRSFYLTSEPANPPLSPRRNREGTLGARYDISSSLKNASSPQTTPLGASRQPMMSTNSLPFPSTPPSMSLGNTSPRYQYPHQNSTSHSSHHTPSHGHPALGGSPQAFVSSNITFAMRSAGRGSPRDALTPGSPYSPFRTSSDGDIPATFSSGALSNETIKANDGDDGKEASALAYAESVARDAQRSYFTTSAITPRPSEPLSPEPSTSRSRDVSPNPNSARFFLKPNDESTSRERERETSPMRHSSSPVLSPYEYSAPSSGFTLGGGGGGGAGSISPQMGVSPPASRYYSFPPLSHPQQPYDAGLGSGSMSPSRESSETSSPSLTTDSTALSSPATVPASLFMPRSGSFADVGGEGVEAGTGGKHWDSFLDQ